MSPNVTVSHNVTISYFKLDLYYFIPLFTLSQYRPFYPYMSLFVQKRCETKYTCIPLGEER